MNGRRNNSRQQARSAGPVRHQQQQHVPQLETISVVGTGQPGRLRINTPKPLGVSLGGTSSTTRFEASLPD
eukprot:5767999-Prymnesium_polylepis.1